MSLTVNTSFTSGMVSDCLACQINRKTFVERPHFRRIQSQDFVEGAVLLFVEFLLYSVNFSSSSFFGTLISLPMTLLKRWKSGVRSNFSLRFSDSVFSSATIPSWYRFHVAGKWINFEKERCPEPVFTRFSVQ